MNERETPVVGPLQDRVILVTGAGRGLGAEYARMCAAAGAKVVVNDLGVSLDGSGEPSPTAAEQTAGSIRAAGGVAVASGHDITSHAGGEAAVNTAIEEFGRIDGVVCNAGILRDSSYLKLDEQNWDAVLKVHLYGGYNVTHAAWPHMREQRYGRILVTTSTTGIFGNFGQANYGAAKAGLIGLIDTLAIEGAKYGITANAIAPMASTRMTQGVSDAKVLAKLPPGFVAPVTAFLVSEACTDTGMTLIVGGGQCIRLQYFASAGAQFDTPPTIAEVASRWSEVMSLESAVVATKPYE